MNKLKKYNSFEEMKSDNSEEENVPVDVINKRYNDLKEFIQLLRNNDIKEHISSTEGSRTI